MATLKLTIFKAKVLKDGRHKIRIAVCHKKETCYIVTRFIIDNLSQFKDGQVTKRPDASIINSKLRSMMNDLQDKLDEIILVSKLKICLYLTWIRKESIILLIKRLAMIL